MSQKYEQEVRLLEVTIQKPVGTKYTDEEVCNLLIVKSKKPNSIKVKCYGATAPD